MIRKLIRIGLLSALFASPLFAVTKNKPFQAYNFSKGLDSYHNSQSLPEGFVQDSDNVLFDGKSPVTKRSGFAVVFTTKTYSYSGMWTYTDSTNTSWIIVRSSDQLTASNLSGSIVKVATISVNNLVGETNAFGNAYFVDQTQGVFYWNGSSTSYISGSPRGSIIAQFHNRLWVTGLAVPNGNQLYGSAYYNGNSWTTGLNPTDPVQLSIGLQDNFDNITAEYVYLDTLYLFKHYTIFGLYGFDQTTFQVSQLTQECGCIDGGSIQTYNGGLKFVSLRGVEDFNGYSCKRISDAVKDKVDPAIQSGGFSQQSWVLQSQSDWQSGTLNNTNASISPPSLVLSTFTVSDTLTGTLNQMRVSGGQLLLGVSAGNVTNYSFESGGLSNWDTTRLLTLTTATWSAVTCSSTGNAFCPSITGCDSTHAAMIQGNRMVCTASAQVLDNSNTILFSQSIPIDSYSTAGCAMNTLSNFGGSSYINKRTKFRILLTCDDGTASLTNTNSFLDYAFVFGGGNSGFQVQYASHLNILSGSITPGYFLALDTFNQGLNLISSGTYTSPTFDTGFTTTDPIVNLSATYTALTTVPTFSIQKSGNGTNWTDIGHSTGTDYTADRYVRYISSFVPSATEDGQSYITSPVTLNAIASSGTFRSPVHTITSINSWGNFPVTEALNGGNIAFSLCSSANSNMSAPNCAVQSINSQITVSTGALAGTYVQWYATFTITASTQNPALQSGTVQWFTGTRATPMSSTVWDNRYWLSLTTNTVDTAPDTILVLNKNGAWAPFDIHAGGLTQYKGSLYHADSNATGNVYLDNQGFSDNGSAINAYVRDRTYSLGDFSSDDYLYTIYPSAVNTGSCVMSVSYQMDKSGTNYSLGSPLLSEYSSMSSVRLPFPIDSSHQDFGQSVDFTFGTNDAQCDWQFYGYEGLFKSRVLQ